MDILKSNETVISDVINRVMNCRELKELYVYGRHGLELSDLYPAIQIKPIEKPDGTEGIVYLYAETERDLHDSICWIHKYRKVQDFIVYVVDEAMVSDELLAELGVKYVLSKISKCEGCLFLIGKTFDAPEEIMVPDVFRVLAIVHFYNEADVLGRTIEHLLNQELDVYLIDNWSDDGSFEIAGEYQSRYPGRIYLEHFPKTGRSEYFELYSQLERTEEISRDMDYDWFIHYDADEMRIGPWQNISLRKMIYWADKQGYNCIENTVIDFRLTKAEESDIFMQDVFFDFRHRKLLFNQMKTWKKTKKIELKSSGGHFARMGNPRMYPLKILNRHYPLRSMEQARKKIFHDRLPRFQKEKQERGWHWHYDRFCGEGDILYEAAELLQWKSDTWNKLYIPLFLECGIRWDEDSLVPDFRFEDIKEKNILLYGAGTLGRKVYLQVARENHIVGWADRNYEKTPHIFCEKIISPEKIKEAEFDCILIAVKNADVQQSILLETVQLGIDREKILLY